VDRHAPGIQEPDRAKWEVARGLMKEAPVLLDEDQRALVEATIRTHCQIRKWTLCALNARSNHVHVVVTAPGVDPDAVMNQFKAWCSRRLNELDAVRGVVRRERWWTRDGSAKWINEEDYLNNAIRYVAEGQ
jgi:REP element-mobilizing transposase RayT